VDPKVTFVALARNDSNDFMPWSLDMKSKSNVVTGAPCKAAAALPP
jgi:hypothetical protein